MAKARVSAIDRVINDCLFNGDVSSDEWIAITDAVKRRLVDGYQLERIKNGIRSGTLVVWDDCDREIVPAKALKQLG